MSNRGPSAYQPNALPLGQTGSLGDVSLVEFMYSVFTCTPGESYPKRLRGLSLGLCGVFRAPFNSLVCRLWRRVSEQTHGYLPLQYHSCEQTFADLLLTSLCVLLALSARCIFSDKVCVH